MQFVDDQKAAGQVIGESTRSNKDFESLETAHAYG